jgi:hypothetical protein
LSGSGNPEDLFVTRYSGEKSRTNWDSGVTRRKILDAAGEKYLQWHQQILRLETGPAIRA